MKQNVDVEYSFKVGLALMVALLGMAGVTPLRADTITIGGTINQSTQDGTGPAVNNPDLNSLSDGDLYTVIFNFTGTISSPGTYDLTGFSLSFNVPADRAVENSFNFASATVAQSGSSDVLSILACLTTGSACNQGNELDLTFSIPSTDLNAGSVAAQGIPGLLPLDLLEDDGATDIHGSITNYSYTPPSTVPEPSTFVMLAAGFSSVVLTDVRRRRVGGTDKFEAH